MKTKLVVAMLLGGSSLFAETHFSIGIGLGAYGYAAPPVVAYAPPCPGPGYAWVEGYWEQEGPRRFWHEGYWAAPQFRSEYQSEAPFERDRYEGRRNYEGRDDDRTYGNSYYEDRNHFSENRSQNSFNANREQSRFDRNRYDGDVTAGSARVENANGNRPGNTRTYGNSYNGNHTDQNRFGTSGNQFSNGFVRR